MTKFIECEYGQFVSVDYIESISNTFKLGDLRSMCRVYDHDTPQYRVDIQYRSGTVFTAYFSSVEKIKKFHDKIRAINASVDLPVKDASREYNDDGDDVDEDGMQKKGL